MVEGGGGGGGGGGGADRVGCGGRAGSEAGSTEGDAEAGGVASEVRPAAIGRAPADPAREGSLGGVAAVTWAFTGATSSPGEHVPCQAC